MPKRIFDLVLSAMGLVVLAPFLLCIAVAIKIDSRGPVFFRQSRVGRYGKVFRIHKFRTMRASEPAGPNLTVGSDPRITEVGFFLRKYKLDELAQLLDVLKGDMSLVGPRPEVPEYVAMYPKDAILEIFSVRPGITDLASIEYKDENQLLANAIDPLQIYRIEILPVKVCYYLDYVRSRSFLGDVVIILKTIRALVR